MPYDFHSDKDRYFRMQFEHSRDFILPVVRKHLPPPGKARVLEIGSAEAGVLRAFTDLGIQCSGIELSASRVEHARRYFAEELEQGLIDFRVADIFDVDPASMGDGYDLIILKDVIEHIHDQNKALGHFRSFLRPGGMIFFTMPPWLMPFGGHQQLMESNVLRKLPWFHVLPMGMYKGIMRAFGENDAKLEQMAEIKDTGLSLQTFSKYIRKNNYTILDRSLWFINPNYKYKFGMKPRKLLFPITAIPWLRDIMTTSAYVLIKKS